MNTCPVYRRSGGHSYGSTVPGPIGSVLTPGLDLERYASLPFASTLCGSCTAVCPVKIDLDAQLFRWRQRVVEAGYVSRAKRVAMKASVRLFDHPRLFRVAGALARRGLRILPAPLARLAARPWATRARAAGAAGAELPRVVSAESARRRPMSARAAERARRHPRRRARRASAGGRAAGAARGRARTGESGLSRARCVHRRGDGGRRDGRARARATSRASSRARLDGAASVLSFAAGVASTMSLARRRARARRARRARLRVVARRGGERRGVDRDVRRGAARGALPRRARRDRRRARRSSSTICTRPTSGSTCGAIRSARSSPARRRRPTSSSRS